MKACALLCLILTLSVGFRGQAARAQQDTPVTIATGPVGGIYSEIGDAVVQTAADANLMVNHLNTNGSWENLGLIDSALAQFGLTQEDALREYVEIHPACPIKVVRPLYKDYLHILVRRSFIIRKTTQWRDLRIFNGLPRSGTALTTRNLMDALGISAGQFKRVYLESFNRVSQLFQDDSLDVAFFVGGLGNTLVSDILGSGSARLFGLDPDAVKAIQIDLASESSVQSSISLDLIPAGTYRGQTAAIQAVSVPVLLVTHSDTPEPVVERLLQSLVNTIESLNAYADQGRFARIASWAPRPPIAVYDLGLVKVEETTNFVPYLLGTTLLTLGVLLWIGREYLIRVFWYLRKHAALTITFGALATYALCTAGVYYNERAINESFGSLAESAWSILVYLASGMEDRGPITPGGKVFSISALLMGPTILALVTGYFASALIKRAWGGVMTRGLRGHYVMLNWNDRSMEVINQLHNQKMEQSVIVVVSDNQALSLHSLEEQFKVQRGVELHDVVFVPANPGSADSFARVNALETKSIIIMADSRPTSLEERFSQVSPDEKSIQTLFALKDWLDSQPHTKDVDVVIELLNLGNARIVEEFRKDFPGTVDYAVSGQARTLIVAQSAVNPGLSDAYRDLLSVSDDSSEFYSIPVPEQHIGRTFPQCLRNCIRTEGINQVIPIGVGRRIDHHVRFALNPKPGTPCYTLVEGDQLLVLACSLPKSDVL